MQSDALETRLGALVLDEDLVVHDAGQERFEVALLEDVDGVGVAHRHHPVYFFVGVVLALICSGFGIASSSGTDSGETIFWGILVGSVVFVIGLSTYFLTRQLEITVHAGNLGMRSAISFKQRSAARKFAREVLSRKRTLMQAKAPPRE